MSGSWYNWAPWDHGRYLQRPAGATGTRLDGCLVAWRSDRFRLLRRLGTGWLGPQKSRLRWFQIFQMPTFLSFTLADNAVPG